MKNKYGVWMALVLVIAMVLAVPAGAETSSVVPLNDWVIERYWVGSGSFDVFESCGMDTNVIAWRSYDAVEKGNDVDLVVRVQNSGALVTLDPKIVPVVSSFNGVRAKYVYANAEKGYMDIAFENAQYQGVSNEFSFQIDGEKLSLIVRECVEYVEPEMEEPPVDQTAPVLQVGRADQPGPIAAGQQQVISLWVQNLSDEYLEELVATVSPSGGLMLADNSVTYPLYPLRGSDVTFFDVTVQGMEQISSQSQSLEITLQYTYRQNGAAVQGSATHTVPLTAQVTKEPVTGPGMAASVPNLIVSGYDYGEEKLFAGQNFDLELSFWNTSSIKRVENVIMTVVPGSALAITNSSNSFHFASLDPGQTQTQSLNLQVLPDAPTAPASISIRFSYEYVDGDNRQTVTAEQSVSLPVYQLDRFELTQEMTFVDAWQYEESFLTLNYINKGKNTVYNVSAELVGDVSAMSRVQHVGNVDSGKSGTIDFIITPELAGETSCTLVITYEDSAMQVMTKEFTFDIFVNEMYVPEVFPEEDPIIYEEPEQGPPILVILSIAAGVLLVIAVVIVIVVRKKKRSNRVDSFVFSDGTEDKHEIS